jgi:hypothetical protein
MENLPICTNCWFERNGDRRPVRVNMGDEPPASCLYCGRLTLAGIFVRVEPSAPPVFTSHVHRFADGTTHGGSLFDCADPRCVAVVGDAS